MDTINVIEGEIPESSVAAEPLHLENVFIGTFNPSDLEDVEKLLRHSRNVSLDRLHTLVVHGSTLSSTFLELRRVPGLKHMYAQSQTVVLHKSTLNDQSVDMPLSKSP